MADDVEGVGDSLLVVNVHINQKLAVAVGGESKLEVGLAVASFEAAISLDASPGFVEAVTDAASGVEDLPTVAYEIEEAFFDGGEEAGGADFEDALDVVCDVGVVGEERGSGFGVQVEQAGFLEVSKVGKGSYEFLIGGMGLCGEFRLGGFGVEEEGFCEFGTVAGQDVDKAFFGIVAVDVHDEVGGAIGEGRHVCQEDRVAVELDSEGGIETMKAVVVEEEFCFGAFDALAIGAERVNQYRSGVSVHAGN